MAAASPRNPLSRDRIVDAALDLVDEVGIEGLSMRKLGARLGVEAMTLYHHVANKDALLDLLVERVTLAAAAAPADEPEAWRERLEGFARRYRSALLARPRLLPLISTRPVRSPEAMGLFVKALGDLIQAGFAPKHAYYALNSLAILVVGMALAEAGPPIGSGPPEQTAAEETYLERLSLLFDDPLELASRHQDAFDFALAAFLDGLALRGRA